MLSFILKNHLEKEIIMVKMQIYLRAVVPLLHGSQISQLKNFCISKNKKNHHAQWRGGCFLIT